MNLADNKENYLFNQKKYLANLANTLILYSDLELLKKRLSFYKWKINEQLEKVIIEFDSAIKNSNKISWIENKEEINSVLIKNKFTNGYITDNSSICNELNLKSELANNNFFICECKFLIASNGAVVIVSNDPLFEKKNAEAEQIIALASIDRFIPSINELDLFIQLYATFETGKNHYLFTHVIEDLSNTNIHLVVIDNQRSSIMENPATRELINLLNFNFPPVNSLQEFVNPKTEKYGIEIDEFFEKNSINQFSEHTQKFIPYDINLVSHAIATKIKTKELSQSTLLSTFTKIFDITPLSKNFKSSFQKFSQKQFLGK